MTDRTKIGGSGEPIITPSEEREELVHSPQPAHQVKTAPQTAPQGQPQTALKIPTLVRRPEMIPKAKTAAPVRETAAMMLERLEPLIAAQVEEVKAIMEKEKLKPEDVQASLAFNIIGRMEQVCAACGRIGHQYRPVMFAMQNVEMELLEEDFVVATQVFARLGISYAAVVYDEEVLVLRDMEKPADAAKRTQALDAELQRFRAFKTRKTYPDPTNRQWLSERLAAWKPEHATQVVVGQSNDTDALNTVRKIHEKHPGRGGPQWFLLATSTKPNTSLEGQEYSFKKAGIQAAALAIGNTGAAIADQLFTETAIAKDPHDAREMIGSRVKKLIEMAAEQEVD